ncbi:hypothetical protein JTB14_004174 [Gonioctena quinquepunctata]|nr:hypothetical protein JTB14_004174 [Gonioctena quinquepunctata]
MDSFVCKFLVLENKNVRVLKQRKINDEDNKPKPIKEIKETSIKKCLFGIPSPVQTEKMLQEQFEIDCRRFSERFGIDLREIEEIERESNNENISGNAAPALRSCGKSKRRVLKGKRKGCEEKKSQLVMTDFYQTRKTVQSTDKPPKDGKEN